MSADSITRPRRRASYCSASGGLGSWRASQVLAPDGYGWTCVDDRPEGATRSSREAARLHERLTKLQAEYRRVSATQRELEEQVVFLRTVADDAETRRLVAETPLADREWQAAQTDLERHRILLVEARQKVQDLARKRDQLLDRLLEEPT